MAGDIIGLVGGGVFEYGLIVWRQDDDYTMEKESKEVKGAKYSLHWHKHQLSRTPEGFYLPDMTLCMLIKNQ